MAFENVTYLVASTIDLSRKTITIPRGSTVKFCKRGSLRNGTISGDFQFKNLRGNSLENIKFSNCTVTGLVPIYNVTSAPELMAACVGTCELFTDIVITKPVYLKANIKGNGHLIISKETTSVALFINNHKSPLTIQNLNLIKEIEQGTINRNYAIHSTNSSNISFSNCHIVGAVRFVNTKKSDLPDDISENICFENCKLEADFSPCPQGWEYGQDHLMFYSINNVRIENCSILSRNVNRVIKTSSLFDKQEYPFAANCTDGVIFKNNKVEGTAGYGKQFWDMFCGTVNVLIENNDVKLKGFTRFVENKATQKKYKGDELITSTITIRKNHVIVEQGDFFQFYANQDVDNFIVSENTFILAGMNKNPISGFERSCGFYLQGYRSCKIERNQFKWQDEAVGLMLGRVNFICVKTLIKDNTISDANRLYFVGVKQPTSELIRGGNEFIYIGNAKSYSLLYQDLSRTEMFVAQSSVSSMHIKFGANDSSSSFMLEIGKDAKIDELSVSSDSDQDRLIKISNSQGTNISNVEVPAKYIKNGLEWRTLSQ